VYKCDICSKGLTNQQAGTSYPRERILGSPGYWEYALRLSADHPTVFTDDATAMAVQQLITSRSGYTVCAECNRMLNDDQRRVADYRLEKWYGVMQSPSAKGKAGLEAVLIIVGTVFERLSGKWPAWVSAEDKSTRDKQWDKEKTPSQTPSQQSSHAKSWWKFWKTSPHQHLSLFDNSVGCAEPASQPTRGGSAAPEVLRTPKSDYWKCPKCGGVLRKGVGAVFAATIGTATCGGCGAKFSQSDVYGGKYDVFIDPLSEMKPLARASITPEAATGSRGGITIPKRPHPSANPRPAIPKPHSGPKQSAPQIICPKCRASMIYTAAKCPQCGNRMVKS
jgi:rRNA maturation protein Nop10